MSVRLPASRAAVRLAVVCGTVLVVMLATAAQLTGRAVPTDLLDLTAEPYDPSVFPDRNIADAVASASGDDAATTRLLARLTPFAAATVGREDFDELAVAIDDPDLHVEGVIERSADALVVLVASDDERFLVALEPAGRDLAQMDGLIVNPVPGMVGGPISDVECILFVAAVLLLVGAGLARPAGGTPYVIAGLVASLAFLELTPWEFTQDIALFAIPCALVTTVVAMTDDRVPRVVVAAAAVAAGASLLPVTAIDPGAVRSPWAHLITVRSLYGHSTGLQQFACIAALLGTAVVWAWLASGRRRRSLVGRSASAWRVAGGHVGCLTIAMVAASGLVHPAPLDLTASGWMVAALASVGAGRAAQLLQRRNDLAEVSARVADLGSGRDQDLSTVIGRALDDPSARVLHRRDHGYVDRDGRTAVLPDDPRSFTPIVVDEAIVGAVVHDPSVADDPKRLRTACDAVALSLANERLAAEIRSRLDDVRASRQRVLQAEDRARIRLERDLHDGAQQRLTAAMLQLRVVQRQTTDAQMVSQLAPIGDEMQRAIDEIRELARGMRPSALDAGLGAAAEDLAERASLPVTVRDELRRRLDPQLETAAWFVVNEAVVNASRHADASHVDIHLAESAPPTAPATNGELVLRVTDDGVGIDPHLEVVAGRRPTASAGTGLVGLFDRVDALGGSLAVRRLDEGGTRMEVRLPCEP